MTDESSLPSEVQSLPTLSIRKDLDRPELYLRIEGTRCRRCKEDGTDPDGDYPCLLCGGSQIEKFPNGGSHLVCSRHQEEKLIAIGKRPVSWEDAMGFDREGYLEVKGCPICKVPAVSIMHS